MNFIVDRLKEDDKQAWFDLWHQADGWSLENNRLDIPQSNWKEIISGEKLQAFCLRLSENQKPVGYILYRYNVCVKTVNDECHICDIFVEPLFRRKGGGKMLMQAVKNEALKRKSGRISWLANPDRSDSILVFDHPLIEKLKMNFFVRWLES